MITTIIDDKKLTVSGDWGFLARFLGGCWTPNAPLLVYVSTSPPLRAVNLAMLPDPRPALATAPRRYDVVGLAATQVAVRLLGLAWVFFQHSYLRWVNESALGGVSQGKQDTAERLGGLVFQVAVDFRIRDTYVCPASTIFAGWRQSVLPVHLLGLAPLLGSVGPVAGDVKLQDDGVVHDPVNRRGGGHGVGKDALPLREDQV